MLVLVANLRELPRLQLLLLLGLVESLLIILLEGHDVEELDLVAASLDGEYLAFVHKRHEVPADIFLMLKLGETYIDLKLAVAGHVIIDLQIFTGTDRDKKPLGILSHRELMKQIVRPLELEGVEACEMAKRVQAHSLDDLGVYCAINPCDLESHKRVLHLLGCHVSELTGHCRILNKTLYKLEHVFGCMKQDKLGLLVLGPEEVVLSEAFRHFGPFETTLLLL